MGILKSLANFFKSLPWWLLLILVIFFDGLVGGVIRIADGKQTLSKVVGWILFISFILSIVSFITLPAILGRIANIVYTVCLIADIITVVLKKRIVLFAD